MFLRNNEDTAELSSDKGKTAGETESKHKTAINFVSLNIVDSKTQISHTAGFEITATPSLRAGPPKDWGWGRMKASHLISRPAPVPRRACSQATQHRKVRFYSPKHRKPQCPLLRIQPPLILYP